MQNFKDYENWKNFATFPCLANAKIPATKNGFKNASYNNDVQNLVASGYNVALACALSNLIVIDCDVDELKNYNGLKTLAEKEQELGELPKTLTQKTPRGGRHFIFSARKISKPIGKIGKDVDVKFNGYIMIAPSSINGKYYEIVDGVDEYGKFIISDLPEAWINFLNKNSQFNSFSSKNFTVAMEHHLYTNINIDKMFSNCAFLRHCKENADCLSEPEWFSMISILAQIKDSDELIHSLSEPYPKYCYEETQKKIDNARKFGYSQSCEYLANNYPTLCKKEECNKEREVY